MLVWSLDMVCLFLETAGVVGGGCWQMPVWKKARTTPRECQGEMSSVALGTRRDCGAILWGAS